MPLTKAKLELLIQRTIERELERLMQKADKDLTAALNKVNTQAEKIRQKNYDA